MSETSEASEALIEMTTKENEEIDINAFFCDPVTVCEPVISPHRVIMERLSYVLFFIAIITAIILCIYAIIKIKGKIKKCETKDETEVTDK